MRWLPQGRAFPAGKSELLAEKGFRHFLAPGPFNTAQPVSLHFAHLILTDASSVPLPHFGQIPPLPLLPVLNIGLQPIPWRWFPTWSFRYDTKEQGFPLCVHVLSHPAQGDHRDPIPTSFSPLNFSQILSTQELKDSSPGWCPGLRAGLGGSPANQCARHDGDSARWFCTWLFTKKQPQPPPHISDASLPSAPMGSFSWASQE